MKIIHTKNLTILKTWLIGGQISRMGGYAEGFQCLLHVDDPDHDLLKKDGAIDEKKLASSIEFLIEEYGQEYGKEEGSLGFEYYDEYYRLKMPSEKNFKILVKRIKKELEEHLEISLNEDIH